MDFGGSNPLLWQVLGRRPEGGHLTRRTFCWVPAMYGPERATTPRRSSGAGAPRAPGGEGLATPTDAEGVPRSESVVVLVHAIESSALDDPRWELVTYHDGVSLRAALASLGLAGGTVAMEYSPMGELPYVSRVDGGTLDLVRSIGAEVVTSADLLQLAIARWDARQIDQHRRAALLVDQVRREAFALVSDRLRHGIPVDEFAVRRFIEQAFADLGLVTVYSPTVAAGPNSANPHYEPLEATARPITQDEWLLVDLWARVDEPGSPFADVTWVAWTGPADIPEMHQQVFGVVRRARDLAIERLREAAKDGDWPQGWEIDREVRNYVAGQGFGPFFTHRTGHNLGPEELHGLAGVCLDDFETHDTRRVLPDVAFSVEPGIYLPGQFGVRLELNAVMSAAGPHVHTPVQDQIIKLL
jgi:Xaa-Pro aminopeptidase